MRSGQQTLFDFFSDTGAKKRYSRTAHGGVVGKGHRKLERPLSTQRPMHLVLKSDKAVGKHSFLTPVNKVSVKKIVCSKGRKFGVKIADYANVGNHLHIKISISSRQNFQKFLKSITNLIARHVTGARRGRKFGRFWQNLAYTRVLKSYVEELNLRGYFIANRLEAGTASYAKREEFLRRFNSWVYKEWRNARQSST